MIEVEVVDGVGVVRLAHGRVNALDVELCREIERVMRVLDGPESGVRAVVVTGVGRVFSAGVDLRRVVEGGAAYVAEFLPALSGAFRAVFDVGKPVVAAVSGHATGGSGRSWSGRWGCGAAEWRRSVVTALGGCQHDEGSVAVCSVQAAASRVERRAVRLGGVVPAGSVSPAGTEVAVAEGLLVGV
ncbi:enoyl-CoA hydratase/isomerase family protein [Nonomuraea rhodomycinica]|uniref:Enoyl-CoA hydratase/isomerase family protein n=1 Tax=Nonomuraea rhodomycinica TaxID=1712872 RepID=A0A7Y6II38_9ACTN|nr:enoyl-CoA hydratase/isomerase family protein [Nonomuraea rhodomycinica]